MVRSHVFAFRQFSFYKFSRFFVGLRKDFSVLSHGHVYIEDLLVLHATDHLFNGFPCEAAFLIISRNSYHLTFPYYSRRLECKRLRVSRRYSNSIKFTCHLFLPNFLISSSAAPHLQSMPYLLENTMAPDLNLPYDLLFR